MPLSKPKFRVELGLFFCVLTSFLEMLENSLHELHHS